MVIGDGYPHTSLPSSPESVVDAAAAVVEAAAAVVVDAAPLDPPLAH